MRRLGYFLAAILVGALAVSGQDREADEELAREIDRLRDRLRERAARGAPPAARAVVRRIYDVSDLCVRISGQPLMLGNLVPSEYGALEDPRADAEPSSPFQMDALIELLRSTVEPESWDVIEGADIQPKNDRLFVSTIPRVHTKIEGFLTWCRKNVDRRVAVEVAVVRARGSEVPGLGARPRTLTGEEARTLLGRERLGTVALVGWDSQIVSGRVGRELTFVQDYDPEIARDARIGEPITQRIFSGLTAEVQACLDGEGGAILHCQLELAQVPEDFATHATEHGDIELPVKLLTRIQSSFWVPLGRTVVAGGCTEGEDPCLILVTAHRR